MKEETSKILLKSIKFVAIGLFCAFCILIANHYYQIKNQVDKLSSSLSIYIFLDKNSKDDIAINDTIAALGIVAIDEYVDSKDAYLRAAEKSPFIKDIIDIDDSDTFQSYIVVSPVEIPKEEYMTTLENTLYEIENINEIVFDREVFQEFVELKQIQDLYRISASIFGLIVLFLFVLNIIFHFLNKAASKKQYLVSFGLYLLVATLGFLAIWMLSLFYYRTPLIIGQEAVFFIVPFTAILGIIFKE